MQLASRSRVCLHARCSCPIEEQEVEGRRSHWHNILLLLNSVAYISENVSTRSMHPIINCTTTDVRNFRLGKYKSLLVGGREFSNHWEGWKFEFFHHEAVSHTFQRFNKTSMWLQKYSDPRSHIQNLAGQIFSSWESNFVKKKEYTCHFPGYFIIDYLHNHDWFINDW